ncbi:BQ5605_C006g04038 [Microbotryum silenes-dioicae]|uniref:BQ5605_C006g04038 protein n=1 Tax=Microbotryum silenes-dioicae TaxID=796604 RepID=A0A2X0MSY6_9BASI|nr:BQ5605_C006g04038 [Microbotryum silenes-dioicae]
MYCPWSSNLAELDKCRPVIVKQSRIQKMLRWLINESKNSAHSAVSFDGDCTARSTQFRPGLRNNALHNDFDEPVFEHVHVPPPPTDEPIHSWLLFEKALRYLNQDKPTYVIPTGDAPLWEPSDELVLSKLWPHLDPFGLVGFCVERNLKISLDEQVNHLLNLYDSDFDATRGGSNRSSTARNRHGCCVRNDQKIKDTKRYKATTEAEKHINRIMAELHSVGDKIHGTTAQMLDMRN